jgi:hypothetical protein
VRKSQYGFTFWNYRRQTRPKLASHIRFSSAYKLKAACESLGYRRTPNLAACREVLT